MFYLLFKLLRSFVIFINQIPFIHQDNHPFFIFFCKVKDVNILRFNSFNRINHQQNYICFFQSFDSSHY